MSADVESVKELSVIKNDSKFGESVTWRLAALEDSWLYEADVLTVVRPPGFSCQR